ncbi:MAG: Two-component sensor PilS [Labilithrix sp.]|nr:Two-component sensor PilS [Labilithrix sp.]
MKSAVVMAGLAVVALGTTVLFAKHALSGATEVIVRGEGDVLVSSVLADLAQTGSPPDAALLQQELAAHEAQGLRYLAFVDHDGRPQLEAGAALLSDVPVRPGQSALKDKRVKVTGPLLPPRHGPHGPRSGPGAPPGPMLLVVELEPPVVARLEADLTRISVVAAIAGAVLLAFAMAWSRSERRLAEVEAKATREQRLVALGSMSSVMAHELRNPLASLKGHAQLLVEDLEDLGAEKPRKKAERVVAEAVRLELLTTSLLDFVRDGPMELTAVTPAELVARSLDHLASARVHVDLADAPAEVRVDPLRLARAVHNVVDNALQATPDGERVELRVAREGSGTLVAVRDHGPGITAGSEAQIFEPFITTRVKGTGLGLAVARRIAEQHGGTLTGANHPGGGAVFELRFPDRKEPS